MENLTKYDWFYITNFLQLQDLICCKLANIPVNEINFKTKQFKKRFDDFIKLLDIKHSYADTVFDIKGYCKESRSDIEVYDVIQNQKRLIIKTHYFAGNYATGNEFFAYPFDKKKCIRKITTYKSDDRLEHLWYRTTEAFQPPRIKFMNRLANALKPYKIM